MLLVENLLGSSTASGPVYVEDVFSSFTYTGTGTGGNQALTSGLDFSTYGGMAIFKDFRRSFGPYVFDTNRTSGSTESYLTTSGTGPASSNGNYLTFNNNGLTIATNYDYIEGFNDVNDLYVSWQFRKSPKFFDVVTYTGQNTNKTVSHSLGSTPGCVWIKNLTDDISWWVWHRSLPEANNLTLNSPAVRGNEGGLFYQQPTSQNVYLLGGDTLTNLANKNFVMYLFAHDAGGFGLNGTDNIISCGSYTGNGSTTGPVITLGYEPQWVVCKRTTDDTGNWNILDTQRSLVVNGTDASLRFNSTGNEQRATYMNPLATGFQINTTSTEFNASNSVYVYIAIRRGPMKTPTSATEVFEPLLYTGNNADNRAVTFSNVLPDMVWLRGRSLTTPAGMLVGDRMRGQPYLLTGGTGAEVNDADALDTQVISGVDYGNAFSLRKSILIGNDVTANINVNTTSNNHVAEGFRRAPGFFDVVCYTGTGANRTVSHNLGVAPEMMIVKRRDNIDDWNVYHASYPSPATGYFKLNTNAVFNTQSTVWNDTNPTSTVFSVGTNAATNASGGTYVAYLFATVAGVSKVGSYTGTGTTKQIDCGFTGGARFVLIKRTDSTGDWYVWDSARGIVAGNDSYLLLNSTAAEVTNTDYVDTYSAGFEISSTAPAAINANGGSFIFFAVA